MIRTTRLVIAAAIMLLLTGSQPVRTTESDTRDHRQLECTIEAVKIAAQGTSITFRPNSPGNPVRPYKFLRESQIVYQDNGLGLEALPPGTKVLLTYNWRKGAIVRVELLERPTDTILPRSQTELSVALPAADGFQGACNRLAEQIKDAYKSRLGSDGKPKIAIVNFTDVAGRPIEIGPKVSEELIVKLFMSGAFEIQERSLLNKVMQEHRLAAQGFLDPTSARQLGRLLGIDAILTGTIWGNAEHAKINARLISTETGQIAAVASAAIGAAQTDIEEVANGISKQLVETHTVDDAASPRIAIIEFGDLSGETSTFSQILSEELITRLHRAGKFEIIERLLLKRLLEEHKLQSDGFFDPATAKELGRMFAVDSIVTGTSFVEGGKTNVNARLISTRTGTIQAVASASLDLDAKRQVVFAGGGNSSFRAGYFLHEDFMSIPEGKLPEGWLGETFIVQEVAGKRRLVNFEDAREHKLSIGNVSFPNDFRIEWIIDTSNEKGEYLYSMIIGDATVTLDVYNWHFHKRQLSDLWLNNSKVQVETDSVLGKTLKFTLEKEGDVIKVFLDDRQVVVGRYPRYKKGRGLTFLVRRKKGSLGSFGLQHITGSPLE